MNTFINCRDSPGLFCEVAIGEAMQLDVSPQNLQCLHCAAKGHIDRRMVEVQHKLARSQPVEGTYLTYFLSTQKLPMRTIYGNITELLLAGVDTVSACD